MSKAFIRAFFCVALVIGLILASSAGIDIVSASGLKVPPPAPHYGCIPPHSGNCGGNPDDPPPPPPPPTYPPSISGSIACTNPGSNGWCRAGAVINLSASDPQGYSTTIYGDIAGSAFSCPGTSCAHVLPESSGSISYSVVAASGLSASGSTIFAFDPTRPVLSVTDPPTVDGLNDWYVHVSPSFSLSASDATSGLASATFNNGSSSIEISQDGVHHVIASAVDNAGNTTSWNMLIKKDATPPALSFSVPYPPDGLNGWYISQPTLSLTASDGTSGLAGAEFESGGSTFIPVDGTQTISATARDQAGNTTTISQTFKVDIIPPTLAPSITGAGAGGWYNTAVTISLNPQDVISGVGQTEYRIDGGNWQSGTQFTVSTEGEHTAELRVTDNAGNSTAATRSFKLDLTPPHSAFTNPPEGSETRAGGLVELAGASSDVLSGLAATEISLDDGATWQPLPQANGAWSYAWETRKVPDGEYTLLVHADDKAGNRENTARVQVIVGNKPPNVELQSSWWLWEAGHLQIQERQIPLQEVTVRIACAPHHPDVVLTYPGEKFPSEIRWDRQCGNGAYAAESGDYPVTLTACDTLGHCAEATGVIKIPLIAPPVPTNTPTIMPTATTLPVRLQPIIKPTLAATASPLPPAPPPAAPVPPAPEPTFPFLWAPLGFFGLLAALAASSLSDPRPRALRRLGKLLERGNDQH